MSDAGVDLHCHSRASDGALAPADVVRLAAGRGARGIALTDHDTVAGVPEAARAARRLGLRFLAGVEISCSFPRPGTLHMLAYGVDVRHRGLRAMIRELDDARAERIRLMMDRLRALGVEVTWDDLRDANGELPASIGRPHLAAAMVRRGHVLTTRQAFDRYLGGGGLAYVDTHRVSPERAIAVVRAAGGLASLAHPMQLRRQTWDQLAAMVRELAEQGMEGLEAIHGSHALWDIQRFTRLADRLDLLPTGGSDFHGEGKPGAPLGNPAHPVPIDWMDAVIDRLGGVDASGQARRGGGRRTRIANGDAAGGSLRDASNPDKGLPQPPPAAPAFGRAARAAPAD